MTMRWRRMKPVLLATLLAAAVPACGMPAEEQVADYDPTRAGRVAHALCLLGYTGVPMRALSTGHHVVDVTLNGRRASFVLDTGANATVIDSAYAGQFGLTGRAVARGPAIGIGGTSDAAQLAIESFRIGRVTTRQRTIMVTDLSQFTGMLTPLSGRTVHGIVGQDVLKEHRAVVDVDGLVVHLIQQDRDPAPVDPAQCRSRG